MKAKLLVDGKEFPIEILDPELQKLIAPSKQTGYERAKEHGTYFYEGAPDCWSHAIDNGAHIDNSYYDDANYYTSCEVAKNNMRADKLMRQLRRFAVMHRDEAMRWNYKSQKYLIYYDYSRNALDVDDGGDGRRVYGSLYFDTRAQAQLALNTFRDELIWYFTAYKDSL